MKKFEPPVRKQFNHEELKQVQKVFSTYEKMKVDFSNRGLFDQQYCENFAKFISSKQKGLAATACSGTSAIFVALQSLELPVHSEVLASPVTDPGMISPIILLSLKPRVFDHAPNKPYATLQQIKERYNENVKACIINHFSGIPSPEIHKISRWLKKKNVYLIEDCSQSHGAVVENRSVGAFGDIACFSTMFSKGHSTGGTGGVVYTKFRKLFGKVALYLDRGKPIYSKKYLQKNPKTFLVPALNLRSNEILSAIGLLTLGRLSEVNEKRIIFLRSLNQKMILKKLTISLYPYSGGEAPYFAILQLNKKWSLARKIKFGRQLQKKGIPINIHYEYVVTEWPWLKKFLTDSFKPINAINYRNQSMNLLFNENFTERHAEIIANFLSHSLREMKKHS